MDTHRIVSETSFRHRFRELGDYLRAAESERVAYHPRPFAEAGQPYHYTTPPRVDDGRGGYSRFNLFDRDGFPYKNGPAGPVYHPLVVSRYAMRMMQVAAARGEPGGWTLADRFLEVFAESGLRTGAWGPGPEPEEMSSAVAYANVQGCVISAILRLARGKPAGGTSTLLSRALARLASPVETGGTVAELDGGHFLQEAPGTAVRHVLNGCIDGLLGLYDMVDATGATEPARLAAAVEGTLHRSISRFVAPGGWSYYALDVYGAPYLASLAYHRANLLKTRVVALRTQDPVLLSTIALWERSLRSPAARAAAAAAKAVQVVWLRDIRRRRLDICP